MGAAESRGSSTAAMLRSPRFFLLAVVILGTLIYFFTPTQNPIDSIRHVADSHDHSSTSPDPALLQGKAPLGSSADVHNSTLGVSPLSVWKLAYIAD